MRASLDHNHLSVEKFSRWLRAICTIILARNTVADRAKAIGYVEQALTVIETHNDGDQSYPMDERQWLLATSYNTGAECLQSARSGFVVVLRVTNEFKNLLVLLCWTKLNDGSKRLRSFVGLFLTAKTVLTRCVASYYILVCFFIAVNY